MKVTVSAPGKIYLMGEHAVVYGKPALLSAVNLRLKATIEKADDCIKIITDEPDDYVKHALFIVKKYYRLKSLPPMKIIIDSDIPAGYHLGSSASVASATIAALVYYLKKLWNPEQINRLTYEAEKKAHGNPSGGDNTAVVMGGFLWFRKELEFLKSMWQLPVKLSRSLDHFFIIDTGRPAETTAEMVEKVKLKVSNHKLKMERIFNENEVQTRLIALAIKKGDRRILIEAVKKGERTLEKMGVVAKKVVPVIREIEKNSGCAKILGGGGIKQGTGYLLGFHYNYQRAKKICQKYGFQTQEIKLGEEGIKLENNN